MSQRITKLVVLAVAVVVLLSADSKVRAANQTATISRGQTGAWAVTSWDSVTVYYVSDGRPVTFTWWDNWFQRATLKPPPVNAMTVVVMSQSTCYWLRNAAVDLPPQSSSWTFPKGWRYVLYIKSYVGTDVVYLQVR